MTGTIQLAAGQTLPATAKVALVWEVSSGSPDYAYVFGVGTSKGATFEVTLPGPPPAGALNAGLFGVGSIVLLPAGTQVPTGRLTRQALRTLIKSVIGGVDRFGVVYHAPITTKLKPRNWMKLFGPGYRCGHGFKPAGQTFEGFRPIPCTNLRMRLAPFGKLNWVNWT